MTARLSRSEERDGWLSAPASRGAVFAPKSSPRRISPPDALRVNAGPAKIEEVLRRFPGALDEAAETVGITDTGYGEDHCWAEHLGTVIDVNSTSAFSPIVDSASPLRSVHSAEVLTRTEREARDTGTHFRDPRRGPPDTEGPVRVTGGVLGRELAAYVVRASDLLTARDGATRACAPGADSARAELAGILSRVASAVDAYNAAEGKERQAPLALLAALASEEADARRALARALRPVSEVACALEETLRNARVEAGRIARRSARRAALAVPALP